MSVNNDEIIRFSGDDADLKSILADLTSAFTGLEAQITQSMDISSEATQILSKSLEDLDTVTLSSSEATQVLNAALGETQVAFASLTDAAMYADQQMAMLGATDGEVDASFVSMADAMAYADAQMVAYADSMVLAASSTNALTVSTAGLTDLEIALTTETEASTVAIKRTGTAAATSAKLVDIFKMALLGISVAGLAIGIISAKMAGDFQQAMTQLVTSAGESQDKIKMVSDGILAMAPIVGMVPKELAAGMFQIESAGYRGAAGLMILKTAAMGAKAENADMSVVTDALTSALNAYNLKASDSTTVMNTLMATMSSGKMHLQDLAGALGTVLPIAATAHVSLAEVGAAMATMTMQGTHADEAATYLRQLLVALQAPAKKGADALKEIGLSATQVATDMRKTPDGLIKTLTEITQHLDTKFPGAAKVAQEEFKKVKAGTESMDDALVHLSNNTSPAYVEALKNIAGGSRQMMAMFELTGAHISTLAANFDYITGKVSENKNAVMGWADVQGNFNFKLDQAKAGLEAVFIALGSKLLPMLGQVVQAITPVLVGFANWVDWMSQGSNAINWFNDNLQIILPVLSGVAAVILYVLVPAVWSLAAGVIAATWPLLAIAAAVAAVVAILVYAYQHWTAFRNVVNSIIPALESLWNWIQQYIVPALASAWSWIQNNVVPALASMWDWIQSNVVIALQAMWNWIANSLVPALQNMWSWIQTYIIPVLVSMWDWIQTYVVSAIQSMWSWITNNLVPALSSVWNWIQNNVVPALQNLWSGVQQVITTLQNWYNWVMSVIDSIRQWVDKNDVLNKSIGLVKDVLQRVNDFINTQLKPTFNDIKNIINTQFVPALQGISNAVAPLVNIWLTSLQQNLGKIGQALQTLNPYFDTLKKDFEEIGRELQPFLPLLGMLAQYWWIVLIPLAAVVAEMGLFALGIGGLIVILANVARGVAMFATGVAQVFSGLVQTVSGYLQALDDLVHGKFDKIGKDMNLSSAGFKLTWQGAWNVIQGIWMAGMGGIIAGAEWFVTTIFNLFLDLYNSLVGHSIVPDMINGIVDWFGQLPGRVSAQVASMVSSVIGKFGDMANQAIAQAGILVNGVETQLSSLPGRAGAIIQTAVSYMLSILNGAVGAAIQAGANIANGVAAGISSGIGAIGAAINNVASTIAAHLPHSPAKVGPLSRLDEFGPALVLGFAHGIESSLPTLHATISHMMQPMSMLNSPHLLGEHSISNTNNTDTSNNTLQQLLQEQKKTNMLLQQLQHLTNSGINIGNMSLNGIQDLATLQQQLNSHSGTLLEYGSRVGTIY